MSTGQIQNLLISIADDLQSVCSILTDLNENSQCIAVSRLESIMLALDESNIPNLPPMVMSTIENCAEFLSSYNQTVKNVGRPKITICKEQLEYLLSLRLKVVDIAKMLSVSRETIHARLREFGLSVSATYSTIDDDELHSKMSEILVNFPNTGYKRMKGYLRMNDIHVTDIRVRHGMRIVDPQGVYFRTIRRNRTIRRRQYFVQYSNQLWHIDGNLKLIRWGIVIRCGIDGKSRNVTYITATDNNRSESHFQAFLKGVEKYGIPLRTRSDKGGENVLIAKFMIEQRGIGRGSHICGRSVHNQRIERFWRDVFEGYTSTYYNLFYKMEADNVLDVDNSYHIWLLHYIFLDRINSQLQIFADAWNQHPLSTEGNRTPNQLFLTNLPPQNLDLVIPMDEFVQTDFTCESLQDLGRFDQLSGTDPPGMSKEMRNQLLAVLAQVDVTRSSNTFGYDIFQEALQLITAPYN